MPLVDSQSIEKLAPLYAHMFPLPVTTFEYFMRADSRPGYPMLCDYELHFDGSIDRAAFDAALDFAVERNPLFRSLIDGDRRGPLVWRLTDRRPQVDWAPLGTPLGASYDAFVDLRAEIGLHVWVRQGSERSTVLLQFHHSCADGMGGYGLVEDFLAGYAASFPEAPQAEARRLDPERLARREDFGPDDRGRYRRMIDTLIGTRESLRFLLESPRPLAPPQPPAAALPSAAPLDVVSLSCPESVAAGIRRVAAEAGTSVNDVMLRDLFLTLRRWNCAAGDDPGRRRLRILMPQNLRDRSDRGMPSANKMSFAFVTRRATDCDRPERLLESIRVQTELIKKYRLSLYFLGTLAATRSNGLLGPVLKRPFCFTTAVLTNLGDPTRRFEGRFPRSADGLVVGNLVFRRMTGSPPLRPRTHAAFSIFNSSRTLSLCLKCTPDKFTQLDSQRLLNEYVAQLQSTAETTGR